MKPPRPLTAALAALLAGCATTAPVTRGPADRIDLNLCLHYSRSAPGTRHVLDRPGLGVMIGLDAIFQSVRVVGGPDDANGCDLLGEVNDPTVFKQPFIEVFSARSKKYLMRAVTQNYANWRYGDSFYTAFHKDSPLYAHIAGERDPARARPAAPPVLAAPSETAPPTLGPGDRAFGEADLAVVIGIEKYRELPAADYAAADARLVKDYLLALGLKERNIQLLLNETATQSGIKKFVESWLANRAKADSRVFIYYSGHGSPDPATGAAYIVPHDGDPTYLSDTGYPLKSLYSKLGALPVREVAVVLDACFSGAGGRSVLAKGARPMVVTTEAAAVAPKLTVLAAARGAQISTSSPETGHGLFTYHFLKALRDGKKDLVEVYEHIAPLVEDGARALNVAQTPSLTRDEGAESRFRLRN